MNGNYDDKADVQIFTKRLVRFRLCPRQTCSRTKAGGCKTGYGDYIVDLSVFMDAYFEANRQINEYECQDYLTNNCDCNNDDGKGDDFNGDYCEYDCFADAGMEKYCVERNPYKK